MLDHACVGHGQRHSQRLGEGQEAVAQLGEGGDELGQQAVWSFPLEPLGRDAHQLMGVVDVGFKRRRQRHASRTAARPVDELLGRDVAKRRGQRLADVGPWTLRVWQALST